MNKLIVVGLGALALALVSAPRANAGAEEIQDYGGRQVAPPRYYAPRPRPVFYAPPPIGVFIGPRWGYYHRPWRGYGYHRPYWRHRHWR